MGDTVENVVSSKIHKTDEMTHILKSNDCIYHRRLCVLCLIMENSNANSTNYINLMRHNDVRQTVLQTLCPMARQMSCDKTADQNTNLYDPVHVLNQ